MSKQNKIERIQQYLSTNQNFLNYGGNNIIDSSKSLETMYYMLYSIYIYLRDLNNNIITTESYKNHLQECVKYYFLSKTTDYHKVKCAELKFEKKMPNADGLAKYIFFKSEDASELFFTALNGIATCNTISNLIEIFREIEDA